MVEDSIRGDGSIIYVLLVRLAQIKVVFVNCEW